jgi:hypothetical protein
VRITCNTNPPSKYPLCTIICVDPALRSSHDEKNASRRVDAPKSLSKFLTLCPPTCFQLYWPQLKHPPFNAVSTVVNETSGNEFDSLSLYKHRGRLLMVHTLPTH